MNKQIIFVITDNNFMIKRADQPFVLFEPKGIKRIPTVPFYHELWNTNDDFIKYMNELKNLISDGVRSLFIKQEAIVYFPSDLTTVDKKAIEDYLLVSRIIKKVTFNSYSSNIGKDSGDYIALTSSDRVVTLEVYKNYKIKETIFYNRYNLRIEEVVNTINNKQRVYAGVPVIICDVNKNLVNFYDCGVVVELIS